MTTDVRGDRQKGAALNYPISNLPSTSGSEAIKREAASAPLVFSGERLTSAIAGQVEVEHYHRYLLAREYCRDKDILDVASGEGYGTALLAQVARTATGVEIDTSAVDAASKEFNRPNLNFLQGDVRHLPLPDASFDVAVSFETLQHIAEQDLFLSEIRRVLRPHGLLIISTPDREIYSAPGIPLNPYHVLELSNDEFEVILQRHFPHVAVAQQRAFIGSVITGNLQSLPLQFYEKRSETLIEATKTLVRAPYLLAFASAGTLPSFPCSLYIYRDDLDTDATIRLMAEHRANEAETLASQALAQGQAVSTHNTVLLQRNNTIEANTMVLLQRINAIEASTMWRAMRPVRKAFESSPLLARTMRKGIRLVWWTGTFQLLKRYKMWRHKQPGRQKFAVELLSRKLTLQPKDIQILSSAAPEVSIIICTYGQLNMTLGCLKSIADHPPKYPIELIVVDDAYSGGEDMTRLNDVKGIQLIRNVTNQGFLRSCNLAAKAARGRYLHMLNNDTEVLPGAIDALVELLDARQDAGMAGSKLLFPDGRLQEAGGILWTDASGWNYGRGEDPSRPEYNYVRDVDYCSGASIMVRRALFEMLGGFDEAFAPAYYEDTDFAFRLRAQGKKTLFEPRSVIVHYEGMSHGTDITTGVKAHQAVNRTLMLKHWGLTLQKENYPSGQHVLRARDRAWDRKVILIIDHYVPEPDKDGGSRSVLGIINSLLDAGWVVKFWPHNRIYSPIYTPALEQSGVEVIDRRWRGDLAAWLQENGNELDHLMVCRPTIAKDVLPHIIMNTDAKLSFYGLDLHFERMHRQAKLTDDIVLRLEAIEMEKVERLVWRHFDVVIYPSEEEALTVRRMSPEIMARSIIPFCFENITTRFAPTLSRTILFVAGFAHPPNIDAALFLIKEVLPHLMRDIAGVKVILAGSNPTEEIKALGNKNVTVTGYVTDDVLDQLYAECRVSVVPLRFGAGVKGKVVESLSRGLPLVTTPVGAQGIAGLSDVVPVRVDVEGIANALKVLLNDDGAWMAQSEKQINFARQFFSREAMQASVLAALI